MSADDSSHAASESIDLSELPFLMALRLFVTRFPLPAEAQQIDRVLERFGKLYFDQNPSCSHFKSADSAYVFTYAILMLSTDRHSDLIPQNRKMSLQAFSRLNIGRNDGEDYDKAFLESVYHEICAKALLPLQK